MLGFSKLFKKRETSNIDTNIKCFLRIFLLIEKQISFILLNIKFTFPSKEGHFQVSNRQNEKMEKKSRRKKMEMKKGGEKDEKKIWEEEWDLAA